MTVKFDRKNIEFGSICINGIGLSYKQLFARNLCVCVCVCVCVRVCVCVCHIRALVFVCEREARKTHHV
jgi:hypothetical protein